MIPKKKLKSALERVIDPVDPVSVPFNRLANGGNESECQLTLVKTIYTASALLVTHDIVYDVTCCETRCRA